MESMSTKPLIIHHDNVEHIDAVINSLGANENFILENSQSFSVENKTRKPLPNTVQINEVYVDKVKVTEGRQIVFRTFDDTEYRTQASSASYHSREDLSSIPYIEESKKIEGERLTYAKKELRHRNKFFFEAKNHDEFHEVGSSYYTDFKHGERTFLFANLDSEVSQQKTVLGVASFIQYFESCRVLIVSASLSTGYFGEILKDVPYEYLNIFSNDSCKAKFYFHEGISFLDVSSLESTSFGFDPVVTKLKKLFECILCDLPDVLQTQASFSFFFPVYKEANSVSLILEKNKSAFSKIEKLMHFFKSYNVKIKGALMSNPAGVKT
jgi:hypothetical protein